MATPLQLTLQELETARNGYADWATFALRDATTNVCIAVVGEVDHYDSSNNKARAETIVRAVNAHEAMKTALLAYNLIDYTLLLGGALVLNNDPKVAEILEKLSAQIQAARALATPALALADGKE